MIRVAVLLFLALAPGVAVAEATASTEAAEPAAPELSVGVAAFDVDPAADPPDFGNLLANRLEASGVARVVGPAALGRPQSPPGLGDEAVRAWASRSEVGAIAVGRAARVGEGFRLQVALRSGSTGAQVDEFTAEFAARPEREAAIERLAERVLQGVAELSIAPPVSGAPAAGGGGGGRLNLGLDRGKKLSITSDQLQSSRENGWRKFVFTRNVRVSQADVTLRADRLEAFYPPDARDPQRLVASGNVVATQGDREVRCDEGTYDRTREILVCRGSALLRDGDDRVRGEVIEFGLADETVTIRGGAAVELQPRQEPPPVAGSPTS